MHCSVRRPTDVFVGMVCCTPPAQKEDFKLLLGKIDGTLLFNTLQPFRAKSRGTPFSSAGRSSAAVHRRRRGQLFAAPLFTTLRPVPPPTRPAPVTGSQQSRCQSVALRQRVLCPCENLPAVQWASLAGAVGTHCFALLLVCVCVCVCGGGSLSTSSRCALVASCAPIPTHHMAQKDELKEFLGDEDGTVMHVSLSRFTCGANTLEPSNRACSVQCAVAVLAVSPSSSTLVQEHVLHSRFVQMVAVVHPMPYIVLTCAYVCGCVRLGGSSSRRCQQCIL